MLKALLKKEFLEINTFYFQDRKTGKRRSAGGIAGYVVLFVFLFCCMAAAFAGMAALFADAFLPVGLDWLYFSMLGILSVFLSSFVNMFSANTILFGAKDSEMLLSMPIPTSRILFVRMLGLYAWGLLYSTITFLPAVVVYWVKKTVCASVIVMPLAVFLLNSLLILALSCLFGWIVAAVSARLKNKSIVTVLLTLVLIGVYYVAYFRINELLLSAVAHADAISRTISSYLFPFYHMGLAAAGKGISLVIYALIALALLALAYLLLDRSLLRISTMNRGAKKAEFRQEAVKQSSVKSALMRREFRHFFSSPAYMLNMGLGIIIVPLVGVFLLIRREALQTMLTLLTGGGSFTAVAAAAVGCLLLSLNCFSAPSVSLEGRSLWIVQSLPVEPAEVLMAKARVHLYLNAAPALIYAVLAGIAVGAEASQIIFILGVMLAYTVLSAAVGLVLNVRSPNLTWTNETVPIKQSGSVIAVMFGGWLVSAAFGVAGYLLRNVMGAEAYLAVVLVVFALAARLLNGWLKTKGAARFAAL